MDPGTPNPVIISSDHDLIIAFHKREDDNETFEAVQNQQVTVIRFTGYLKYTFGSPGDETIHGHPYAKFRMSAYSFYELKNSDLIEFLKKVDQVHPYHDKEKWKHYKHYIITFHDNMFECVAQGFEIRNKAMDLYRYSDALFKELF